ncbi:V-type ATP synthase subunit I domain-containing protein [Crocosphaera chwakensis]|uniref:Uncharacterized protein n=1 Tax=Crocosphaera chwakensis CCY0110 TaxID=391612 RepID=A3ITY1_9CHRO|nr:hypothetical protein [Crocosphaera chwakensis]EAZ90076.1 hypothetical protein CY0110_15060 [Crocosphaera chwakensis CCY0110]
MDYPQSKSSSSSIGTLVAMKLEENWELKDYKEKKDYQLFKNPFLFAWGCHDKQIMKADLDEVWVDKRILNSPYSNPSKIKYLWLFGYLDINEEEDYQINLLEEIERKLAILLFVKCFWLNRLISVNNLENKFLGLNDKRNLLTFKELLKTIESETQKISADRLEIYPKINQIYQKQFSESISVYQEKIFDLKPELDEEVDLLEEWIDEIVYLFIVEQISEQEIFDLDEDDCIENEDGELFFREELILVFPIIKLKIKEIVSLDQRLWIQNIELKAKSKLVELYKQGIEEIDKTTDHLTQKSKKMNIQRSQKADSKRKKKKKGFGL